VSIDLASIFESIITAARELPELLRQDAIARRETPIYHQLKQEQRARRIQHHAAARVPR
jgi:hypothetical protein